MTKWVQICTNGRWWDSSRHPHEWSAEDFDQLAWNYTPGEGEWLAPVVIAPVQNDSIALAWVEELRADGGQLLAKLRDLVPAFQAALENGRFRRRYVSFYPPDAQQGYRLRHITFEHDGRLKPLDVRGLKVRPAFRHMPPTPFPRIEMAG